MNVLKNNPQVLQTPAPAVIIKNLTDSSIQLAIRPWAKLEDFFQMSSDVLEDCKEAFENAGIVIQPYVRELSVKK